MQTQLIDTHCHVHFKAFADDMDQVIKRSLKKGVFMITVGTQQATSATAVQVARSYDGVWAAVGLHPNHLCEQEFTDPNEFADIATVKTRCEKFDPEFYAALAQDPKVVALGEFGLDYYHLPEKYDRAELIEQQKASMRAQLDLADRLSLPVIIHSRQSHNDQTKILREYIKAGRLKRKGVIHCYTGSLEQARAYLELGFLISFTGIITFPPKRSEISAGVKETELQKIVKELPLQKIMVETDAPYLAPEPYRGQRNEPVYVRAVAEKIAELKKITFEQVAKATWQNAQELFGI